MIFPRSRPDDEHRLPLPRITSPSAGNEAPAPQRINPNNRASAATHRMAGAAVTAAVGMANDTGWREATPAERAAVHAAFEEAKALRRGAEAAAVEEMQRDALNDWYSGRFRER